MVVRPEAVAESLGAAVSPAHTRRILTSLGFRCQGNARCLKISVPAHRRDVQHPQDLFEEVARIYGYDAIPATSPAVRPALDGRTGYDLVSFVKDVVSAVGLDEAITYSLTSQDALDALGPFFPARDTVRLKSPMSSEQAVLRSTVMAGLVAASAHNFNQGRDAVALFEVANVFYRKGKQVEEELMLSIAMGGERAFLSSRGAVADTIGMLHLKGVLDVLIERVGVTGVSYHTQDAGCAVTVVLEESVIGRLVCLPEQVCAVFGLKNKRLFCAEVSLRALLGSIPHAHRFQALPRYPAITRDISCVLSKGEAIQDMLRTCRQAAGDLLKEIRVIDFYHGSQIPAGKKAMTVRCVYRSDERTLKESEVESLHAALCDLLKGQFGALLR